VLLGGAGLILGVLPEGCLEARTAGTEPTDAVEPTAYVRIGTDNSVTVIVKHLEFGQGPLTGLATLVAEELDADWTQIRAQCAAVNAKLYGNSRLGGMQATGGSSSISSSYDLMRRLLELAPEVADRVEKRELEMGHARALLALSNRKQQIETALIVVKKSLSVRETESLVRRLQQSPTSKVEEAANGDPNVNRLEQELAEKLGAKVAIQHSSGGKGKLVVSYNSLDELDGILAHIH
jgi:CO/xanthine dehydrogenase Mo-binding subunit